PMMAHTAPGCQYTASASKAACTIEKTWVSSSTRLLKLLTNESSTQYLAAGLRTPNGHNSAYQEAAQPFVYPRPAFPHRAILSHLAELGYITRQPSATDKRKVLIALSGAGLALLATGRQETDEWLHQALQHACTPEELASLSQALPVLTKLVEAD
nr:hypothetical protein [Tanacetum cinerariifolium]